MQNSHEGNGPGPLTLEVCAFGAHFSRNSGSVPDTFNARALFYDSKPLVL